VVVRYQPASHWEDLVGGIFIRRNQAHNYSGVKSEGVGSELSPTQPTQKYGPEAAREGGVAEISILVKRAIIIKHVPSGAP